MDPIILYHFPFSPVSRAVLLTARSLDIELEIKEVNLIKRENLEPWYLEINPQHTVPVINDNGHILTESRAISRYLVNSRAPGSSLYPEDPKLRSIVDQRLCFDEGTVFSRMAKVFENIKKGGTEITDEHIESIYEVFKWLNDILSSSKWMAGDEITIADTTLLATLSTLFELGAKLNDYPELQRWFDQCKDELPGFEENAKAVEEIANVIKSKLTKGF
ncbi:glutathione S-transferase D6-like [Culicoides brevitarsis]|uniref:glutathione S-transferase D6-like n=1 Tax=Culicoides brevitarsis TaxID=469753 RepID=UPI00307C2F57